LIVTDGDFLVGDLSIGFCSPACSDRGGNDGSVTLLFWADFVFLTREVSSFRPTPQP
jgi:hypothetical protein